MIDLNCAITSASTIRVAVFMRESASAGYFLRGNPDGTCSVATRGTRPIGMLFQGGDNGSGIAITGHNIIPTDRYVVAHSYAAGDPLALDEDGRLYPAVPGDLCVASVFRPLNDGYAFLTVEFSTPMMAFYMPAPPREI